MRIFRATLIFPLGISIGIGSGISTWVMGHIQDPLLLMQEIIGQHPDSHLVIGAFVLAGFFFLTRGRKDSRYLMESSHLTTGWWEGVSNKNRRVS